MAGETESKDAPLELNTHRGDDGSVVVTVEGEVDLSNAERLGRALAAAMRDSRTGRVAIDLVGLRFIDSTGLRQLVLAAREQQRQGLRLTAVNVPREIGRLFQLTALDKSIVVVPAAHP